MKLTLAQPLDRSEVFRRLGCGPAAPDERTQRQIDACEAELLAAAEPRGVFRRLALRWDGGTPLVADAGWRLEGQDIALHLARCHSVLLLAVTLGVGVDRLLQRAGAGELFRAVALDAVASAAAEAAAEAGEREAVRLCRDGEFHTGRFSPGYGDLPIAGQRELLALLDAPRSIGLTATRDALLVPRKSVTALIGVADVPVRGRLAGCGNCRLREKCEYRKRGTTCEQPDAK